MNNIWKQWGKRLALSLFSLIGISVINVDLLPRFLWNIFKECLEDVSSFSTASRSLITLISLLMSLACTVVICMYAVNMRTSGAFDMTHWVCGSCIMRLDTRCIDFGSCLLFIILLLCDRFVFLNYAVSLSSASAERTGAMRECRTGRERERQSDL